MSALKPAQSFNLADLFESVADAVPEREAIVSGTTRLTYAQLEERANRLANHLRHSGIGAGDHVGLYLYNGHQFLEAVLAIFKLRAVPININYRYVEGELRYLCQNADLVALFYQPELASRVEAVAGELPKLRYKLEVGPAYEAALAASSPARDFPQRSGDDLYIIYTGGTTGLPRGVMWRHEDVFYAGLQGGNPGGEAHTSPAQQCELALSGDKALTFLPAAPFIHGAAQWASLICLNSGGKLVISPGARFDAERVAQLIDEEKVNTLTLVGDAMARPLADALEANPKLDRSSLVVIASAGAIFSRTVQEQLARAVPDIMILNNFGASETGHQGNAGGEPGARPKFFFDDTTQVLDENRKPLPPGSDQIGKIARRGRIPLGYYNDPEKTAATFFVIDGERWVIPGDLAQIDADGAITVLGRGAVCINSGGEKIFPEEVEEALKAHPDVLDAVVVGVPDERWGERVAALVQPRPGVDGEKLTLAEIDRHLRPLIAGYKLPRELHLIAEMVRHPSGKPDYRWAKAEAISRGGPPTTVKHPPGATWQLDKFQPTGAWAATRRLARAAHALAERCVALDPSADASAATIEAAAAAVEAQVAALGAVPALETHAAWLDKSYLTRIVPMQDRSPIIGHVNPTAPPLVLSADGGTAIGKVRFGTPYEGMPGHVHGGWLAAAFDQMLGYVGVLNNVPALTGSLTVRYLKPTPLGVDLRFEAIIERSDGRKSTRRARCEYNGEVLCEAEGLFVQLAPEGFAQIMQKKPS